MSVKKKLLIALLSVSCLTAGALGLAACKDKNPDDKDNDKDKDTGYTYTVTAKDDNGKPVEGAWFEIGYVSGNTFVNVKDGNKILTAQSDKSGKATFKFTPEEGKTYTAKTADPVNINDARPVPYGYVVNDTSIEFADGKTTVEYSFNYVPNSFNYNEHKELNYKRVYDAATSSSKEQKGENKLKLEKDRQSYFYLLTYKESGGETEEELAVNQENNTRAASGIYEVSFKAVDAAVTMYSFNGSGYVFCDEEGIPSFKTTTVTEASQPITLSLTVSGNQSRMPNYFGIYADKDCEVEIDIKRVGDSADAQEIQTKEFEFTAPTEKFADSEDKLTPVTIPNNQTFVKGNDGFYHIGNASGPLLLITLTEKLDRIGELSLQKLPSYNDRFIDNSQIYIISEYEDGELVRITDYTKMIEEYSKWVNKDGVYPVNDDIYAFLQVFQQYRDADPTNSKDTWLIPCQFYVDENGIQAEGDGSAAKPFILIEAVNKLSNTGATANLTFTANTAGAYAFEVENGSISAASGANVDGTTYIALAKGQTVNLSLTGAAANTSVTVSAESEAVAAVYGDDNESKGVSADTAIRISGGINAYVVDNSVCEDGVWVYFSPFEPVKFKFEVLGSPIAQIVYNGTVYNASSSAPLTIDCVGGESYKMLLTAKKDGDICDGVYLLNVYYED